MRVSFPKPEYRRDIDGLRAVAVMAVVFYHFGIGSIKGGFVGVDVFFVISGYLITGIIYNEISRGEFSFGKFYERRIRRIFPALFMMLFVTTVVGLCVLLPTDLMRLGERVIATIFFGSNVLFWRQAGYFNATSELNPLLHTWSLAVEEQFYIGLPFLLIMIQLYAKAWIKPLLSVFAVGSLLICIWATPVQPTAAFFLAPFRAWELLLGSLLAVGIFPSINGRHYREIISIGALLVLVASLLWMPTGAAFPGWHAVFPVLATATLLHTGRHGDSLVKQVLSFQPLVFIGLISYSLYLWHWPLIVYVRYTTGMEPLTQNFAWILLVVSILLAVASYQWVEKPFRQQSLHSGRITRKSFFYAVAMMMAGVTCLALVVRSDAGWQRRFSADVVQLDVVRSGAIPFLGCERKVPSAQFEQCRLGVSKGKRVLLWGDSHALAWAPAIDMVAKKMNWQVTLATHSACAPLIELHNTASSGCRNFNEKTYEWIRSERPYLVILVASWISYSVPNGQYSLSYAHEGSDNGNIFTAALDTTLKRMTANVIVLGPTPGAPTEIPLKLAVSYLNNVQPPVPVSYTDYFERSKYFWGSIRNIESSAHVVDTASWFCGDGYCKYYDKKLGLLYRDGGHLSVAGADFVGKKFLTLLKNSGQ